MNKVEKKRQKEQYVVDEMVRLYCRKNHKEQYADPTGDAVLRSANAVVSSDTCDMASYM